MRLTRSEAHRAIPPARWLYILTWFAGRLRLDRGRDA